MSTSLLALSALLTPSALAWDHTGYLHQAATVEVWVTSSGEHTVDEWEDDIAAAFAAWEAERPCHLPELVYMGEDDELPGGFTDDGIFVITLGDPQEQIGTAKAATMIRSKGLADSWQEDGEDYYLIEDSDIVMNLDAADYITLAQHGEGDCSDQPVFANVLAHELGHLFGLGHSCEYGDSCTTEEEAAAMYWDSGASCSLQAMTANEDDYRSITGLYGFNVAVDVVSGEGWGPGEEVSWNGPEEEEVCLEATVHAAPGVEAPEPSWSLDGVDLGDELPYCGTFAEAQGPWLFLAEVERDECHWVATSTVIGCADYSAYEGDAYELSWTDESSCSAELTLPYGDSSCLNGVHWALTWDDESVEATDTLTYSLPDLPDGEYALTLTVELGSGTVTHSESFSVPQDGGGGEGDGGEGDSGDDEDDDDGGGGSDGGLDDYDPGADADGSQDKGGCGCATGARRGATGAGLLVMLGVLAMGRRREG